jgi:cystathionine gamma-synthase
MDIRKQPWHLHTWLVSAGRHHRAGSPLNVPLVPASNFIIGAGREYPRDDGTPAWEALEEIVGGIEGGHAVAFASGMAAIAAIFDQLRVGAIVVIPDDCYHGVVKLADADEASNDVTSQGVSRCAARRHRLVQI